LLGPYQWLYGQRVTIETEHPFRRDIVSLSVVPELASLASCSAVQRHNVSLCGSDFLSQLSGLQQAQTIA